MTRRAPSGSVSRKVGCDPLTETPSGTDPVNHPKHYNLGGVEVITAIEAWGLPYHQGNVVKYVARSRHKGRELEDLEKARWYLNRAIENLKKTITEKIEEIR